VVAGPVVVELFIFQPLSLEVTGVFPEVILVPVTVINRIVALVGKPRNKGNLDLRKKVTQQVQQVVRKVCLHLDQRVNGISARDLYQLPVFVIRRGIRRQVTPPGRRRLAQVFAFGYGRLDPDIQPVGHPGVEIDPAVDPLITFVLQVSGLIGIPH